jgi:hypothetical protein
VESSGGIALFYLIRGAIKIQFNFSLLNRDGGLAMNKSWEPVINTLKEKRNVIGKVEKFGYQQYWSRLLHG